ncbi:MAG: tRNA (N(6)-L-threonylcarbamoyladenosine(37)-C(2))-methylthiotransferase MtaB [Eubacterium sp.]
MKKAALHNLGCKVNAYETDVMTEKLKSAGYKIVNFEEKADVYIINTCTVTNIADRKSRQMLHKAKNKNPDAIVVAVGCYVQAAGEKLANDDAIDIVIGNNKKKDIVEILSEYESEKNVKNTIIDINHTGEYEEMQLKEVTEHIRAYIKIQDGCNQFCSYCIIPYARGRIRSRHMEDIISEVTNLARQGFQEIVLTGIHLSSYGLDLQDTSLIDVIKKIESINGIMRIRLGSLEPRIITEEFVRELKKCNKICPHFHLSLQSGCNTVLKRMNRKYTTEEYLDKCRILRKYFDNPAITTDIIVGFPGETTEEFEETKRFVTKAEFFEIHVFKYSKREGTKAALMPHQISGEVKNLRSHELIFIATELSQKYIDNIQDTKVEVLFEEQVEIDGTLYWVGHTKEYVKIAVISDKNLANKLLCVKVIKRINTEISLAML